MAVSRPMPARRESNWDQFKAFISRGNVLDLAVAIILGIAFGAVIFALVNGILMPLIAAIAGEPSFSELTATVGDGVILYGTFIEALVNFLIIAAAMFFVVKLVARMQRKEIDITESVTHEEQLLEEIRDILARQATAPR